MPSARVATRRPQNPQLASAFLKLPTELKNEIYRHYFQGRHWFILSPETALESGTDDVSGLLLSCQQVYQAAAPFRYTECVVFTNDRNWFEKWLSSRSGTHRLAITQFEFQVYLTTNYKPLYLRSSYIDEDGKILRSMPNLRKIHICITATTGDTKNIHISADKEGIMGPLVKAFQQRIEF
ncbi:hypothetical protein CC86DRAFT_401518 [Ophiobolus disseminans]|uniref:Uncharacterized protein n=1 Tax=Ophiobolus disseminans TaxID=1469910 RepID=A0A6A7ACT1_9PLEO|nr:hypothetical protein CC86DRAFT_401518 [Ophiobolus disseminans]